jgi:DNA adenine methylase
MASRKSDYITPLRYSGGKQFFSPFAKKFILGGPRPKLFIECFAGGASVSLSLAQDDLVDHSLLIERDPRVAAFWRRVFTDGEAFAAEAEAFDCRRDRVVEIVENTTDTSDEHLSWWTLVQSRCGYGGSLTSKLMNKGDRGRGVASRWNGPELSKSIRRIHGWAMEGRISFEEGDAFEVLRRYSNREDVAVYADPPYVRKGSGLYKHGTIDHERLFRTLDQIKGRWLLTYDDCERVRACVHHHRLAARGFASRSNHKNKLKYELMISRELSWLPAGASVSLDRIADGQLLTSGKKGAASSSDTLDYRLVV